MINDVILLVLISWIIPLSRFVFYSVTVPVPDTRWRRRLVKLSALEPITRILVAQKTGFILVVAFIFAVRFLGTFPGREWVAFGLYLLLVILAWVASIWQRRIQKPLEREIRKR